MDPLVAIALGSWKSAPGLMLSAAVAAVVYTRGWRLLRTTNPAQFTLARLACFHGGLAIVLIALLSPLDALGEVRLSLHMLQHLLLMMVAPPLLWLGAPALPLLRGLPNYVQREWIGPFAGPGLVRSCFERLGHPVVCWTLSIATVWLWHVPGFYERALADPAWHVAEHLSFLAAGLLFWWPVVQPYPSHARWSRWAIVPYLLLADVQNTVFSAIFCFSPEVVYAHYARLPHFGGASSLDDQALAGAIMWIPGSILFFAPVAWVLVELMSGTKRRPCGTAGLPSSVAFSASSTPRSRPATSATHQTSLDLLRLPLVKQATRSPRTRLFAQLAMLAFAVAVVADGFFGPQLAPTNIAGVWPWTHWRGLSVLALLAVGNLFCFACPLTLPRRVAEKFLPARLAWPSWLRTKWIAVALVVLYLGCYEVFSLWASPWWTAWLVVGYFAAALVVESLFRGAPFCKYLCPIGQFHFVQSLVSPFEIRARDSAVCATCSSHDCLHGNERTAGCQTQLFVPQKRGNLDCTLCLDCVRACPADNVGLLPILPAAELTRDVARSGIGRWSRREDMAALVTVLAFGAFANAAGMVAPVLDWQDRLAAESGAPLRAVIAGVFLAEVLLLPALVVLGATWLSRRWLARERGWRAVASRFAMCLAPLGAAMWIVHFSFHLATSAPTAWPVVQRAAGDVGLMALGAPDWQRGCCAVPPDWLLRGEILCLAAGLVLSLHVAYRTSCDLVAPTSAVTTWRSLGAALPWGIALVSLYALGLWIVFQPMQMRGTMLAGGG